ncbi:MAG: ABC transporter permease [Hyphomicrobiales bacterium]
MIGYYIKVSIRNLLKYKLFSVLNIVGLSIAIIIAMIIFLFVNHELTTDKHIKNGDHIAKAYLWGDFLSVPFAKTYENKMASLEVLTIVHYYRREVYSTLLVNDHKYNIDAIEVDSNYLKVFDYPLLSGDSRTALRKHNSILLSESRAKAVFGDENPVGRHIQSIDLNSKSKENLVVTGVFKDFPSNSSQKFNAIVHSKKIRAEKSKGMCNYFHYLRLNDNVSIEDATRDFYKPFEDEAREKGNLDELPEKGEYGLMPISEIYFSGRSFWGHEKGNLNLVYIYLCIGILIILVAGFNFINLTSSLANKRAKETGIRKVVGVNGSAIFSQLIIESMITCFTALVISLILLEVIITPISSYLSETMRLSIYQQGGLFLYGSVLVALFLGFLAGIYPALVVSSFPPIKAIKGEFSKGLKGLRMRRALIIIQFVISVVLIISTVVILYQVNYIKNKNLGFDKEHVVFIEQNKIMIKQGASILDVLNQSPYIKSTSLAYAPPGYREMGWGFSVNDESYDVRGYTVDENYIDLFNIEMLKGEKFSKHHKNEAIYHCILNETAAKKINTEIIGEKFNMYKGNVRVIGVCKDYYINNPANGMQPVALFLRKKKNSYLNFLIVKFEKGQAVNGINYLKDYWAKNYSDYNFNMRFLNDTFNKQYKKEERLSEMFAFFAIFSIFIACLGLFGLSAFMAEQRTKEIGVRKVLGANEGSLIRLQAREYLILVFIANIIAWPIAYYLMNNWLNGFAEHINFKWYFFGIALIISLLITMITVSYMAMKASRLNPIDVIKSE